jgi:hypothetical protein
MMSETQTQPHKPRSALRILIAGVIGLAGSVLIWLVAPHITYIISGGKGDITAGYLPVAAIFLTIVLSLVINPLLRLVRRSLALNRNQLAVVVGMWLVACTLPTFGLLGTLPYSLAKVPQQVRDQRPLAAVFDQMDLPPSLFPEKLAYNQMTPVSDAFVAQLLPGESIPWDAWTGPMVTWGTLMLFAWLMMIGMSMILFPQWRRSERLTFPLLLVQQSLIEEPEGKRSLPPVFYRGGFWFAVVAVFLIHLLSGLHLYRPETFPPMKLDWNAQPYFDGTYFQTMPSQLLNNRIYFTFIGIAFFVPGRIAASIWIFALANGLYRVIGNQHFPPHINRTVIDFRLGAAIAMTLVIVFLSRARWWAVFKRMFRFGGDEERKVDGISGWMFLVGLAGIWFWLIWAGTPPVWALLLLAWGFMICILIARIIAETGMPFFRISFSKEITLMKLAPVPWVGPVAVFMAWMFILIFNVGSREGVTPMSMHALGLNEDSRPRFRLGLSMGLVILLVAGFVIGGASHLWINYNHMGSMDGTPPVNPFGSGVLKVDKDLQNWQSAHDAHQAAGDNARSSIDILLSGEGFSAPTEYYQPAYLIAGAIVAGVLYVLCITMPTWPIHPIGILLMTATYGAAAWASVLIGWVLKTLIVKWGGSRLYQRMRPVFLGLIVGEILAAVFWTGVSTIFAMMGEPYVTVTTAPGG